MRYRRKHGQSECSTAPCCSGCDAASCCSHQGLTKPLGHKGGTFSRVQRTLLPLQLPVAKVSHDFAILYFQALIPSEE